MNGIDAIASLNFSDDVIFHEPRTEWNLFFFELDFYNMRKNDGSVNVKRRKLIYCWDTQIDKMIERTDERNFGSDWKSDKVLKLGEKFSTDFNWVRMQLWYAILSKPDMRSDIWYLIFC